MNPKNPQYRPTMAELLEELSRIHELEPVEIEIPPRQDRPNAMLEMLEAEEQQAKTKDETEKQRREK